jgi:hypothetical protein
VVIENGEIRRKERTSTGDTGHEDEIKKLREDYDTLKREVEELRRGSPS